MTTQRKPGPQATPAAVDGWRRYEHTVRDLERAAERDPAGFADWLVIYTAALLRTQEDYRDYLRRRFGIKYRTLRTKDEAGCRFHMTYTEPKRAPRTRQEKAAHAFLHLEILAAEAFFRDLLVAIEEAKRNGADVDRAMCEAFLGHRRLIPAFYVVAARASSHPAMREAALLRLSAWLETQVAARVPGRPEQPTRIKRALDDEGLTLREALPPAALLAFADMEPGEPLRRTGRREKTLVNRVENYLAKQGREATEKENKLTGAPPPLGTAFEQSGSVPRAVPREVEQGEGFRKRIRPHLPDDVDLQDFELAEEARQQGDQLRDWIEEAELSKQERQVYELDMRTDYNTKVAARKLDIDDVTVRQYRKRYQDKLRKARRAAGF